MRTNLLATILVLAPFMGIAQDANLVGQDARLVIDEGAQVVIEGHLVLGEGFSFVNDGVIAFSGDLSNNAGTTAITGEGAGSVQMIGQDQLVGGSSNTQFNQLTLTGEGVKTLDQSALVSSELHLQDAILETQSHILHITNPDANALTWDRGFVQSSTLGGALARSTNSSSIYPFPVGDQSLQDQYRAVDITPTRSDSSVFMVRLAAIDAGFDRGTSPAGFSGPFDLRDAVGASMGLNDQYYHNVYQSFGAGGAEVSLYFFERDYDREAFNQVKQWNQEEGGWEITDFTLSPSPLIAEYGDPDRVAHARIAAFTSDSYILGAINEFLVPEIFSPNGDGINDYFQIRNIEEYPNSRLEIFNRWGNKIYTARNYRNDWDGTHKDSPLPNGTYFYFLDFGTDTNLPPLATQRIMKGFFEIKR